MKRCIHNCLILLCIVLYSTNCYSQISNSFFQSLPDSLKPVSKERLSITEANKILKNAFNYSDWTPSMYAESDQICYLFAKNYNDVNSTEEMYEFLHTVCNYLYFSKDYNMNRMDDQEKAREIVRRHCLLGIKYCNIFIKKFPVKIVSSKYYLSNIYLYKTHFFADLGRHIDAYYAIAKSIQISRDRNLPNSLSIAYAGMAYIVGILDLSDQALANYDSAFAAIKNEPKTNKWAVGHRVHLNYGKQVAFLSKYRKTGQKQWADSVHRIYNVMRLENPQFKGALEAEANIAIAAVEYEKKNYLNAINRIDTAIQMYPDMSRLGSAHDGIAYKALSLLKLEKEQAGRSLLKTLNFSRLTAPVIVVVLEELYRYEKYKGDFGKAMEHHEQLLAYVKKKAILDLEGKALEMEQFYQVKQKEQQILQLEGAKKQNLIVAVFFICIVICLMVFFIIRYRNGRIMRWFRKAAHFFA